MVPPFFLPESGASSFLLQLAYLFYVVLHLLCESALLEVHRFMPVYEYDLKEILPRLHGPLKAVLDRELSAGNTITEIPAPWPMKNANVWLAKRFHFDYAEQFPILRYRYLGDPRNWIEEYIDAEHGVMIAVSAIAGNL